MAYETMELHIGKGILYINENQYDGEWKDSEPHGIGSMLYASGDKYDG